MYSERLQGGLFLKFVYVVLPSRYCYPKSHISCSKINQKAKSDNDVSLRQFCFMALAVWRGQKHVLCFVLRFHRKKKTAGNCAILLKRMFQLSSLWYLPHATLFCVRVCGGVFFAYWFVFVFFLLKEFHFEGTSSWT